MNPQADDSLKCIALCTVGELFGGVERHVLGMSSTLQARGISTLLILFHNGELAARARELGIEPMILPDSNLSLVPTSGQLADIVDRRNIRIVHAHGYKAMVFCAMARRRHRFALIKTEHGLPEQLAGHPIGTLRAHFYHLLDRAATRLSNATVCYVTEELLTHHRRRHSTRPARVIPNGVGSMDRHQFLRPPEMREDWFNLVIVGRLELVKGHHLAIEAVAAKGISPDVHLHILGDGPRLRELQALTDARNTSHRVHILGFRRNIYDYIAHCDVLLMPSLHEGLPYTLLEAMALGVPIIASRVGGLAEVVRDQVTGLLVAPGDAAALGDAIGQLKAEPALRARLGEQARRLQQERYSLEAMTERYLEVYQKALLGNA